MSKKQTGLGTSAFFSGSKKKPAADAAPETPKPEKIRTTVMLSPEAYAGLEQLKSHARRQGQKATYSDLLDEAIRKLMVERKISSA